MPTAPNPPDVPRPEASGPVHDAVVVGGGVAGLVAARELAREGLRVLVLEGRDAPGGAVRAHTVAGLRLDAGAESYATRGGSVAELVDELGLTDRVRTPEAHGSWVHLSTGDGPLPRTGLLGVPSSPLAADVRRTLGLPGALRAACDLVLPGRVGRDVATLGALVRARMGARALDRLVRPIVSGVHAADPDDLAVGAVAPALPDALRASRGSLARAVAQVRAAAPAGSAVQGLDGGIATLTDALVADLERLGGEVRVRSSVGTARVEGDVVVLGLDGGTDVRAARLVVAAPRPDLVAAATGTGDLPALDDGAAVVLVTLVLDQPALDAAPRGTGVLVGPDVTDVRAKALTHGTAKWAWLAREAGAGRHVVRLSYGRADERVDELPTGDALVDQALRDASVLLGVPLTRDRLAGSAVVRWTQALPRPSAAHRAAVAAVRAAAAGAPGRVAVAGAWVAGNGLASVVPDARAAARALVAPPPA